jgi:hypothetical protein
LNFRRKIDAMSRMSDVDMSVFSDAYKTTLDDFTDAEQTEIRAIASRLRQVLEAAKKRDQERVNKAS